MTSIQLSPPRKVTIVDSIIEQLVAQVKDGTLKAGDKLPSERELMSMLGVCRSSVRESLQALAAMGMIVIRPGVGAVLKKPSPSFGRDVSIEKLSSRLQKDMRRHLNEARLTLELGIVSMASERITDATGAPIRQAMEAYEATTSEDANDQGDWTIHDRLHLAIAEATGNPILVTILQDLLSQVPVTLRRKRREDLPPGVREAQRESGLSSHRQLCEAVLRGDGPAACEAIRRHAEIEVEIINEFYLE